MDMLNEQEIEELLKKPTEELIKEFLKLRDDTDWGEMTDFSSELRLLNRMAQELRKREYGVKK
jgi:hypothetical protein